MITDYKKQLIRYLEEIGMNDFFAELFGILILVIATLLIGFLIDRIIRNLLIRGFSILAAKSKTDWDDLLIEKNVFSAVAHLPTVFFIFYCLPVIFEDYAGWKNFFIKISEVFIIIFIMFIIFRLMDVARVILKRVPLFKDKPIDSYIQLFKIIIRIIIGILILSILADKSVSYFLGAFGAIAAALVFAFKDTILGFIASIQLSSMDMLRVGDWVQLDKFGADGDVIQINLTTIKVRNWDKTITTVPTYSFISDSFVNWRGMEETGARRIARSIYIDQSSIKFCTPQMIDKFKKINLISGYIQEKEKEIVDFNTEQKVDLNEISNGRRMTNLGTFRAYLLAYLKNHPKISQNLTMLVRQMPPNENGLPLQIYAFVNDTAWANYEAVQSDIFDHTLAVIEQFDLKVFQSPSGSDFRKLATNSKTA